MKILQQPVKVKKFQRVLVHFNKPCNIYLMTELSFKRYKEGASFRRLGGHFEESPAEFIAPYDGTWHAVIEKGSHFKPLNIEGRVEILPPKRKEVPYINEENDMVNDDFQDAENDDITDSSSEDEDLSDDSDEEEEEKD